MKERFNKGPTRPPADSKHLALALPRLSAKLDQTVMVTQMGGWSFV